MKSASRNLILIAIAAISTLMHLEHFPKDLMSKHIWRQTQTQSTIINFYEEDMNILNPRRNDRGDSNGIFRMEFPLMQWMVACLYKILGNHLIITRIFMFIVGFFTVFGVYRLLDSLFQNTLLSVFGAWAFNFSPSFYYYTINPLPDNLALCCSTWGLALFFIWYHDKKLIHLIFSGIMLSVGALCKLPFIVFFVVPFVHFVTLNHRNGYKRETLFLAFGALVSSVLPMAWYLIVVPQWKGNMIVKGMLGNNDTARTLVDYLQFHLVSTLPESLLNYGSVLFFLAGFYFLFKRKSYRDERFVLLLALSLLVLTYFFFEINAIAKAHDYYLFPFYPLLFILVPYGAYHMYRSKFKFFRYLTIVLLLILPFTCYLRIKGRWNSSSPGFNKDLLIYKTELRDAVPKNTLVVAGNDESHYIFFYYIDKKGWGFDNNNLLPEHLAGMIEKGAEYLYTDSDIILNNSDLKQYIDRLILERGTIKIYHLKELSPAGL